MTTSLFDATVGLKLNVPTGAALVSDNGNVPEQPAWGKNGALLVEDNVKVTGDAGVTVLLKASTTRTCTGPPQFPATTEPGVPMSSSRSGAAGTTVLEAEPTTTGLADVATTDVDPAVVARA